MAKWHVFVVVGVVWVGTGVAPGQPPQPPVVQLAAMKKLDFLVGQWQGEGWMEFAPGQRRAFKGSEVVHSKLDGLLLGIDGIHRALVGAKGIETVIHSAFGLLRYDEKAKQYRFQAFTTHGNYEDAEAKVTDGQLVWGMVIPQFGEVRYTIKLDDKGQWFEIGELIQDGKVARKFFEMTLKRSDMK